MRTDHSIRRLAVALLCAAAWAAPAAPAAAADPLEGDPAYFAAAALFSNGYHAEAAARLAELLKRYPRDPRLQLMLAESCVRQGQVVPARQLYSAVVASKPQGRCEAVASEWLARLDGSGPEAGRPGGLDSPPAAELSAEQVAALSVVHPEPSRRRTEHFDIVTSNPLLTEILAQRAELIFDRVRRTVLGDQLFAHRVELVVFADQPAFANAHPAPHWSGGGYLFSPQADGTVRRAVLLYQVDDRHRFRPALLSRELPHELAHVVLREFFGQTACPLWLEEGLACAAEADGGRAVAERMREILDGQTAVPLADMMDTISPTVSQPTRFYAQAASWTRFLRSNLSDAQMKTFLGQLKDGHKPSVALGRALFLDDQPGWLAAMEERWHQQVRARPD